MIYLPQHGKFSFDEVVGVFSTAYELALELLLVHDLYGVLLPVVFVLAQLNDSKTPLRQYPAHLVLVDLLLASEL